MKPVVVGTDGSGPSEAAVAWAAEAAAARRTGLDIIYAWFVTADLMVEEELSAQLRAQAEQVLERAQRIAGKYGLAELNTRIVHDLPARALIEASDDASLVVVGNRGHGGFHDMLLGSTSVETAMHAQCPVVVVRPYTMPPDKPARIVVGVDGSEKSVPALDFAFEEAQRTGAKVVALHAWQGAIAAAGPGVAMPFVVDLQVQLEQEKKLLRDAVMPWRDRYPAMEIEYRDVEASTSSALVQASRGAHLVVVGSRGHGGFTGLLLGSAGLALIHHAACPVVIAHTPQSSKEVDHGG